MRIGIREQLGLLVLLTTLIALAVVAVATWVNNYDFVLDIRTSGLTLAASLYANQLGTNLLLLQTSVQAMSTRIALQTALQRYNNGNNTDANWVRAAQDMSSGLAGGASLGTMLVAQVRSKNGTGIGGPYGLLNVTSPTIQGAIPLPHQYGNGTPVYLGDNGTGYPLAAFPNLTFTSTVINATFNQSNAFWNGEPLYSNSTIFLGPWLLNETFALTSITVPVVNDTAAEDILGWITVINNAKSIFAIADATEGLGDTGQILIVAPTTPDQKLPSNVKAPGALKANASTAKQESVKFALPPVQNSSQSTRHSSRAYNSPRGSFEMSSYPAVLDAYSKNTGSPNNAGSIVSTKNEQGDAVSVGYALPQSPMVDWALVVEQSRGEAYAPINHLRNVLVACVFGTAGGLLLLLLPLAHLSVRPIRRLRDATKKTVEPYRYQSEDGSVSGRSSPSSADEGSDDSGAEGSRSRSRSIEARKEGFFGPVSRWRAKSRKKAAERKDRDRLRTFRIPGKVEDRKHYVHDELTDLTRTYNEMSEELMMQYERLEQRVKERTYELEASKKAAEAANESKTAFIANISHELKTPLNGILGMCAVCMQEDDHTKIKRSLGIIYKSGDLLLHLLTDLLTFTKNQIGQHLTLDEREFRLADVCSQVISIFDKQARDGSINLGVTYQGPQDGLQTAGGAPLQTGFGPYGTGRVRDMFLWGDQHRILQVIINLVSNSLKFTPPNGSVNVRIRCVGDAPEKAESARKGSLQSKQSKHSRQSKRQSPGGSRRFGRMASSESGSSVSPSQRGRPPGKYSDTALHINGTEPKAIPTVHVRERSSTPPPAGARILLFEFEVEDTGPGIPESQRQRVFEPFVQGDIGLNKKYGGTGLGLSICSQLASLMKGSMELSSEVGVGSKFTMRIPLIFIKERADSTTGSSMNSRRNSANLNPHTDDNHSPQRQRSISDISLSSGDAPPALNGLNTPAKPRLVGLSQPFFASTSPLESPDKQLAAMEQVAAQVAQSGDKIRVLVAEDNKVNQEVVLRMLKLEDIYDVTVAKDGQEAFDLVKESMEQRNFFNLIFMDVQMPNLDGIQSTRLIRRMGYSAPIVALTAFAEESNVKECIDSGMDFFLPKPIRRPALKDVLKRYCPPIPEAAEEADKTPPPLADEAVSPLS
ncbi:Histidine kinase osmosensor [Lecanora helva]